MGDHHREPREPGHEGERVRETERTTIVHSDGGRRGGGAGILTAVLIALLLIVLLFFLFRGGFDGPEDEVGVNVDVDAPELSVPEIQVPDKIEVDVPDEINVDTDGGDGNAAE